VTSQQGLFFSGIHTNYLLPAAKLRLNNHASASGVARKVYFALALK